ncbi:MAG: SH3 domain-containing protein [Clostridium sp.]|nr:SH3 domain-containing protein [Clostridium sp.]
MKTMKTVRERGIIRVMMVILMASLLWLMIGFESRAEGSGVIIKTVNIREGAGLDYERIGSASTDSVVTIAGQAKDSSGTTWYQIFKDANTLGFVRSDYIKDVTGTIPDVSGDPSSTTPSNPGDPSTTEIVDLNPVAATAKQDDARVRENPTGTSDLIGTVGSDQELTVTGKATGTDGYIWYRITYEDSEVTQTGFVRSDFLTLAEEPTIATGEPTTPGTEPEPNQPTTPMVEYELAIQADPEGEEHLYLLDYANGSKYKVNDLLTSMEQNKKNYEQLTINASTVAGQKIAIIILVTICCLLVAVIVYMIYHLHELKDDSIYPPSPRAPFQHKEGNKLTTENRKVMQTVAATNSTQKTPIKQSSPTGSQPRPQGGQAARPQGGQTPRPQGGQAARTQGGQAPRPQGGQASKPQSGQTPRPQGGQTTRPQSGQTTRPQSGQTPRPQGGQTPRPQGGQTSGSQADQVPGWKSKNFMADDDEFEFEFLPIDTTDQK